MNNIPFGVTDWSQIEPIEHRGEKGVATWCTQQFDTIRVRRTPELKLFIPRFSRRQESVKPDPEVSRNPSARKDQLEVASM